MRWAYILAAYMFIYRYLIPLVSVNGWNEMGLYMAFYVLIYRCLIPLVSVNGWNEMGLYMSSLYAKYRDISFHSLVSTDGMRWAYI